jgi:hypothetical protein
LHGDGPIAVAVQDLNGGSVPVLAVFNGGSGTVTELPGVGRGFFDDRQPKTLFNFGSALVQPPTFAGTSGLGYAVTAAGDLVRFDLSKPSDGATVVFSAQAVLAAEALASGQVVAALANGDVSLLVPHGSGLTVGSVLAAQGGIPALPSAIDVVSKPGGLVSVLVTSEGSDDIFVFDQQVASAVAVTLAVSTPVTPPLNTFQPTVTPTVASALTVATNATAATATASAASTSSSASTSSGAVSAIATSSMGLSLGSFSSLGNGSTNDDAAALLVSVQGNSYLSVPILDFGSGNENEADDAAQRMPRLSGMHSFGDTSSLTRFVIGLDEALREYGSNDEATRSEDFERFDDLWNEDLFRPRLTLPPPPLELEKTAPRTTTLPAARRDREGVSVRFREESFGESQRPRDQALGHASAGLIDLAGFLAAVRLRPAAPRSAPRHRIQNSTSVAPKARRRRRATGWGALSRADCDE